MKDQSLYSFTIPIEKFIGKNTRYSYGKNRVYMRKTVQDYLYIIALLVKKHIKEQDFDCFPLSKDKKLSLSFDCCFQNARRDLDGVLSIIVDALEGILYVNDNQIYQIGMTKTIIDSKAPEYFILKIMEVK